MTERNDPAPEPSEAKRDEPAGSPLPLLVALAVLMGLVILYGVFMN